MTREFHVTAIRNNSAYGHDTFRCNPAGCSGYELYLGDTVEVQAGVGDLVELEFDNESPTNQKGT